MMRTTEPNNIERFGIIRVMRFGSRRGADRAGFLFNRAALHIDMQVRSDVAFTPGFPAQWMRFTPNSQVGSVAVEAGALAMPALKAASAKGRLHPKSVELIKAISKRFPILTLDVFSKLRQD